MKTKIAFLMLIIFSLFSCGKDEPEEIFLTPEDEWCGEEVEISAEIRYLDSNKDTLAIEIVTQNFAPVWEEEFELEVSIHGDNAEFKEKFQWTPNEFVHKVPIAAIPNNGAATDDIEVFSGRICVFVPESELEDYPQCPDGIVKNYEACTELTN